MLGEILLAALIPSKSQHSLGSLLQVCAGLSPSCPELDLLDILQAVLTTLSAGQLRAGTFPHGMLSRGALRLTNSCLPALEDSPDSSGLV